MNTRSMERLIYQGQTGQLCAFGSFRRRWEGAEEAIYRENLDKIFILKESRCGLGEVD